MGMVLVPVYGFAGVCFEFGSWVWCRGWVSMLMMVGWWQQQWWPFIFLLPNLDLVLLLVVCACTRWWLVVANLCLHFQVSRTIQTLKNVLLKIFYCKIFYFKTNRVYNSLFSTNIVPTFIQSFRSSYLQLWIKPNSCSLILIKMVLIVIP